MTTINVVRCANGVQFDRIAPGGMRILGAIDVAAKVIAHDLTLTAGTNDHEDGPHVRGDAFDIRVRDLTTPQVLQLHSYLTSTLGPLFTVLYEAPSMPNEPHLQQILYLNVHASGPHIHVQTKRGTTYPPEAKAPDQLA